MSEPQEATPKNVRRDDSIPPMARLLFEEIWAMHQNGGCYAGDEWLSNEFGVAESSVRRYRRQLREAGYITQAETGDKRWLIPTALINSDQTDQDTRSESSDSDQNQSQEVINSDQDRDNNLPAEARESARTRGDETQPSPDAPEWAPSLNEALRWARNSMGAYRDEMVRQWWYHRDENGWNKCGENWHRNLQKWKTREHQFSHDGAPANGSPSHEPSMEKSTAII